MNWQHTRPRFSPDLVGRVVVLEAEPGPARDAVVRQWLADGRHHAATTWLLNCAYREGGIWAGLADLFQDLVPEIRERAPDLLSKHSAELYLILPTFRKDLPPRNPTLTETVSENEKTRNYPADRAYRSLHGLIDLLDAWHRLCGDARWVIACDQYDQANGLVHRFFGELMRRRGQGLKLILLVATAPGAGDIVLNRFDPSVVGQAVRLDLAGTTPVTVSKARMTQMAHALEDRVAHDAVAEEIHLPRLIHYWEHSDAPEEASPWQIKAMNMYNHQGLYEASAEYGPSLEADLERLHARDWNQYFRAGNALFFCYLMLDVGRAQRILEGLLSRTDDPVYLPHLSYLMAMQLARYLRPPDLAKAEEYLLRSLEIISAVGLPEEKKNFLTVFSWNGLAFVRVRQGRYQEALDLCHAGIARLNEYFGPEQHQLHRSVLVYNIAQVYAEVGPYEEALAYFSEAMATDPNYSEYYNERGNVHMKMERFDEAEQDYLHAVELSPPYAEVWTNLGQRYRIQGRMTDAVQAYSRALDLNPKTILALVGRADANTVLEQPDAAQADYDTALALDPAQPLVLASRAILHYEAGRVSAALEDLDQAVSFAPQTPTLYQNRAVALRDLGRALEAAQDLRTYLRLHPDAEDRGEVEHMLSNLEEEERRDAVPA